MFSLSQTAPGAGTKILLVLFIVYAAGAMKNSGCVMTVDPTIPALMPVICLLSKIDTVQSVHLQTTTTLPNL